MEKDQRPPGATDHAPPRDARPGEGKHVTQFSVATTECAGNGKERPEYQFSVATNEYIGQGKEKAEYRMIAMPSATKYAMKTAPNSARPSRLPRQSPGG
jgi:hypothetical protein